MLERAYRRFGARYPALGVAAVPQLAHPLIVLNVALLSLFVDMSLGSFVEVAGVAVALMAAYNLFYVRVARRRLVPVTRWLEGDRGRTVEAWQACASQPAEMMRQEWLSRLGVLGYAGLLAWAVFFTWRLELPAYTVAPLFAGVGVFILYLQSLRFFGLELVLRPVLRDLAAAAASDPSLAASGLPLRTRLLVALPAINIITGVAAVAVVGGSHGFDLLDLGLAVVVSIALAATLSLALTLLLARSVTEPITALRAATEQVARGDFTARVPVVTTDETGALARSFNEMAAGLEQRERLREAFGTFLDPSLVERVAESGIDIAGEEVDVSLLFMDIRGFTTYSEQAKAQEVVARLNELYGEVVPVITRFGGHANKFIGDGLLAVFGAPVRLEDHAGCAVKAGLDIVRAVEERFDGALRVGVGINSGSVVVGTIGGGGRLDFTVIGDAVNTAARVESATRQTGDDLLITEATLEAMTGDPATWIERPGVTMKGKTRGVRVFAAAAGLHD